MRPLRPASGASYTSAPSVSSRSSETASPSTRTTDYDHNPRLRGHYTRSKIDADRIACAAARSGKPVVVVRPGRIYGYDHPQQPLFFGRVKKWFGTSLCGREQAFLSHADRIRRERC